jgi:hypothetical protein
MKAVFNDWGKGEAEAIALPKKGSPIKGLVKRKNTPSIKKNNFFF